MTTRPVAAKRCPHCAADPGERHEAWCPYTAAANRETEDHPSVEATSTHLVVVNVGPVDCPQCGAPNSQAHAESCPVYVEALRARLEAQERDEPPANPQKCPKCGYNWPHHAPGCEFGGKNRAIPSAPRRRGFAGILPRPKGFRLPFDAKLTLGLALGKFWGLAFMGAQASRMGEVTAWGFAAVAVAVYGWQPVPAKAQKAQTNV